MCLINRRKKWKAYCLITVVLIVVVNLIVFPWKDIRDLTELEKCPACFGITACPLVLSGRIKLSGFGSFAGIINLIGFKNVWFGTYEKKKVVIKKLASNWELKELDKKLCGKELYGCSVSDAVLHVNNLTVIENLIGFARNSDVSVKTDVPGNFYLCPSTARLSKLLQLRNRNISAKTWLQNVWTIFHINPEPLLLEILTKEEGWPVPSYYGSCGRIIVEEYIGDTLTSCYNKPWIERAKLAYKLLIAAKKLTYDHPEFRFYLTDISPDNIAVDDHDNIYFIDLENVIVVDKKVLDSEKPDSWASPHVSEIYECASCFTFSLNEICSHEISDHNLYAVCQHLLSPKAVPGIMPGGLLHSIPYYVLEKHPNFSLILTQCGESAVPFGRFNAANQLLELLGNVKLVL